MTIEKLTQLLQKRAPDCYKIVNAGDFAGRRIAVDANQWIITNMSVIWGNVVKGTDVSIEKPDADQAVRGLVEQCLRFVKKLLGYGITPIFVFDGQAPDEKSMTREERTKVRQKNSDALKAELAKLETMSQFDYNEQMVNNLKKLHHNVLPYFGDGERELLKSVLTALGIPVLIAVAEGEQLCSMLCRDGWAAAVFSSDSDNLPLGCPILITGFTERPLRVGDSSMHQFKVIHLQTALQALGMTLEHFIDMCILLGCDFNDGIRGIGAKKAYDLIKAYQTLENIQKYTGKDVTILKVDRCREIFYYRPAVDCISEGVIDLRETPLYRDLRMRREIMNSCGFEAQWSIFNYHINNPPQILPISIIHPIRIVNIEFVITS